MFDDDTRTRDALHVLIDEPVPPTVTTVEQVIRQGRRRAFVQRAAAVAGVGAVVAAIGVGAMLIRPPADGAGVAATPPPTSSTTPLLPGWTWVDVPARNLDGDGRYCASSPSDHPEPQLDLPPQADVEETFYSAIARQTGAPSQVVYDSWEAHSQKTNAPNGFVEVNVPMDGGPGSVQLEVGRFGGEPEQAADLDVTAYGNCAPPSRRLLDNGAVLQLYQANEDSPELPMQHLRVYRPNGRLYVVTTAAYGESDKKPAGELGGYVVEDGRGRLPLDAAQLAEVARSLAALDE
ncbi:MAG: hypothetical protein GEV28_10385 [Actinophytocola sp.]|uniref:hypothetical protein n=1 Tax=Actinophytocola sp. TaxID=1872138 RepID=UPI001321F142|nr:hypothetical protein [Actinophytocola sp.]MPZ80773.1 hypothetical protein [Actinophytocola sp.]